ncbi:MAG: ABC transporter ATP-binding protein/permease [Oscillospiraceae bacterium]|nr:ABC transporter ATP-binding protein/permease [Oscillospiraceae bacterium]
MLKLLRYFTKREWGLAVLALLCIVLQVWMDLTMPGYMSQITTLVETEGSAMRDILYNGGMMLLCALGSMAASVATVLLAAQIASGFSASLRARLFDRVESFSIEEISRFSTASLITRTTNDVTQVEMFVVMGLQMLIKAPITAVWAVLKIAGKSWQWTFATGVAVAVLVILVGIILLLAMPKFRMMQRLTDDLNRVTRENLTGLSVVRAYNAEEYHEQKFEPTNDEVVAPPLYSNHARAFLQPGIQTISNGLTLAIYWIGAYLIGAAAAESRLPLFSDMVVFSSYALQVVLAFMMLVMVFMLLPRASVSAKRIGEVLDTQPTIIDGKRRKGAPNVSGEVEFRNVSFRYPDSEEYVLHNVSFTAHRGETVAIIGSTGSGKSTLINLVPRFYDVTEGQVLVDGADVREYAHYDLNNKIGYVSQKATLFSGTVRSNIAFGDNGRDAAQMQAAVPAAAATAQASEFVEKLPDGYDGYVAQLGRNFSGGQKQRISIARAVCRDAEILIFDDSFSALDYKTDRILRAALRRDCTDATKLIVAQRIGTIRDADRIIVLDRGEVAGIGTHAELMKDCDVYRQIAYSQLSKEELA